MPRRTRPNFPREWHKPDDQRLWITWARSDEKLRRETVYWVSTAGMKGKPHAAPVWGIWKANMFYFETAPDSAKGRNLRANPSIVVHVQDGLDTVILEGDARRVTDDAELRRIQRDYVRKYDYRPDWSDTESQVVFRVIPQIAHAWRAPKMHSNLVNFDFRKDGTK